jgi:hypothetical protein
MTLPRVVRPAARVKLRCAENKTNKTDHARGSEKCRLSVALVVAGFLAVALAGCVWIILSFPDARVFFFGDPTVIFGQELYIESSTLAELVVGSKSE